MTSAGYRVDTLVACGGDMKNPTFVREHADVTGCRLALPREPEAVLLGSAMLGAVAAGAYPDLEDAMAAMNAPDRVVEPATGEVADYHARKHAVFHRMYEDQLEYRKTMPDDGGLRVTTARVLLFTRILVDVAPQELALEITPRARLDFVDVREQAGQQHGTALEAYSRCLYHSPHTTAGYLPQSLATRLSARAQGIGRYLDLFRTVFPEGAGYLHDQLELRNELPPAQRQIEPTNADSHLAFIAGGLHACVSYVNRRPGPVYFIDLDGVNGETPRHRVTTLVGYNHETVVARATLQVPVSSHPINAVNLKDPRLGLYAQVADLIERHGVTKGRVRLELDPAEHYASLTVNEYETLLMQHDLAEVLRNPLRFAAEKARHAWNDPRAVPGKALDYAKYDLVRALNRLVDALGLGASRIEHLVARALEAPVSRFLRMKRSVDLLVSDTRTPGEGAVVEGTYQTPIMVQWRPAPDGARAIGVTLTRFQ